MKVKIPNAPPLDPDRTRNAWMLETAFIKFMNGLAMKGWTDYEIYIFLSMWRSSLQNIMLPQRVVIAENMAWENRNRWRLKASMQGV